MYEEPPMKETDCPESKDEQSGGQILQGAQILSMLVRRANLKETTFLCGGGPKNEEITFAKDFTSPVHNKP